MLELRFFDLHSIENSVSEGRKEEVNVFYLSLFIHQHLSQP